MEMELLDNGAIRCIVGQSDLEKHNLTMLDFVIHPESSRSMLQEFINLARIRYGFCPAGNTLIEAVPLAKDRLVLTFSNGQPPFFSDMMRDSDIPETDEDEYDDADAEDSRDDAGASQGNGSDSFGSPIGRAEFGRPGAVSKRSRRHASREPEIYRNTRLLMSCNDILGADGTAPATPVSEESEEVVICRYHRVPTAFEHPVLRRDRPLLRASSRSGRQRCEGPALRRQSCRRVRHAHLRLFASVLPRVFQLHRRGRRAGEAPLGPLSRSAGQLYRQRKSR